MNPVDRLAELITRYAPEDGVHQTAISRLVLIRASHPNEPLHTLHKPALCIVAQGKNGLCRRRDGRLRPQRVPDRGGQLADRLGRSSRLSE